MALSCWYCLESKPIVAHDSSSQPICQECSLDLPPEQLFAITLVNNDVETAYDDYQTKLATFNSQKDHWLTFLAETKDLPWRLLPGRQDQPTWNQYYQASLKSIALTRDRFDHIKALLEAGLTTATYPEFSLSSLPKVIKVCSQPNRMKIYNTAGDTTKAAKVAVVVSEDYFQTIASLVEGSTEPTRSAIIYNASLNSNLSLNWLQQHPEWPWSWSQLHKNSNFDISWVAAFPDKNWDFDDIAALPQCDISWLSYHPELTMWEYLVGEDDLPHYSSRWTLTNLTALLALDGVSVRYNLVCYGDNYVEKSSICEYIDLSRPDPEMVLRFLQEHKLVKYVGLSINPTLNWSWLITLETLSQENTWSWHHLSMNISITEEVFEMLHQHYLSTAGTTSWSLARLSLNPSFRVEWLAKDWWQNNSHGDEWDWWGLSQHPNTTLEVILAHPNWTWAVRGLHSNPNFTAQWLEILPYNWSLSDLGRRNIAKLDWSIFLSQNPVELPRLPWRSISARPDVTWQIIQQYPELQQYWHWSSLCRNPNLVWSDHPLWLQNKAKWDAKELSQNPATTWEQVKNILT